MSVLDIKKYPDPILKKKAKKVSAVTEEMLKLVSDMIETLIACRGVGLAAPQVGFSLQLCIIMPSPNEPALVLFNPAIKSAKGRQVMEEGCLSIQGVTFNVKRFDKIVLEALNIKGKKIEMEAGELLSRIIQHELDHLNGILIFDRVNVLKRLKSVRSLKRKKPIK